VQALNREVGDKVQIKLDLAACRAGNR